MTQWKFLYTFLPSLLLYTYQLIVLFYYGTIDDNNDKFNVEILNKLVVGYYLTSKDQESNDEGEIDPDEALFLKCPICGQEIKLTENIEKEILKNWTFRCKNGHVNDYFDFLPLEVHT